MPEFFFLQILTPAATEQQLRWDPRDLWPLRKLLECWLGRINWVQTFSLQTFNTRLPHLLSLVQNMEMSLNNNHPGLNPHEIYGGVTKSTMLQGKWTLKGRVSGLKPDNVENSIKSKHIHLHVI